MAKKSKSLNRKGRAGRRRRPGAAPGLQYSSAQTEDTDIHIDFGGIATPEAVKLFREVKLSSLDAIDQDGTTTWLHIVGPTEFTLGILQSRFGLHPLALEDCLSQDHRTKSERYESHYFVQMYTPVEGSAEDDDLNLKMASLSIFWRQNLIISVASEPLACVRSIKERSAIRGANMQMHQADYYAYALIDSAIDHYFPILEQVADHLETLEDTLLSTGNPKSLVEVHRTRRILSQARRLVWPLREAMNHLAFGPEDILIAKETRVYYRDCFDHAMQLRELHESCRESTLALFETYRSTVSAKTNEIMRMLTLLSTIFLPLTFVAGIYGMNFDPAASGYNMPELSHKYGYIITLCCMAVLACLMLYWFHRKGWLFPNPDVADIAPDDED